MRGIIASSVAVPLEDISWNGWVKNDITKIFIKAKEMEIRSGILG